MDTFGKRLRDCRKEKGFSQNELAKILNTNHSVIGGYERDDVKPSIDVAKKLADLLNTTIRVRPYWIFERWRRLGALFFTQIPWWANGRYRCGTQGPS